MSVNWDQIVTKLETALNAALDNPSPTYSVNGQSVSFETYISMLRRELQAAEDAAARSTGPYQVVKRGII